MQVFMQKKVCQNVKDYIKEKQVSQVNECKVYIWKTQESGFTEIIYLTALNYLGPVACSSPF